MGAVRAVSLAFLLAFCFTACACAADPRMPKNRCISYAGVARGGNGHYHSRTPPGCSAFTGWCPNRRVPIPIPTEPGVTTAAAGDHSSHVASSTDKLKPALTMAGAKTGAAESKTKYISPAALKANRPCVGRRCPSHSHP